MSYSNDGMHKAILRKDEVIDDLKQRLEELRDNVVDFWHDCSCNAGPEELHEALNMDLDEYQQWVADPTTTP